MAASKSVYALYVNTQGPPVDNAVCRLSQQFCESGTNFEIRPGRDGAEAFANLAWCANLNGAMEVGRDKGEDHGIA